MASDKVVYDVVSSKEKFPEIRKPPCPKGFGIRHLQALLLFVSLTIGYSMRSQLGVLMVAMVDLEARCSDSVRTNMTLSTYNLTVQGDCRNISKWNVYRTYDWPKSTQEIITSALFMGYTGMMIPSGLLAQKFGGKIPIMVALVVNGVLSICFPWIAAMGGWKAVAASRLLQGMSQAAFYPSIHTILGKWAPLGERGRLTSYIYTGSQFGTVLAFQISGFLASSSLGWPSSFWLFGSLSLVSCALLGWFGAATPHEHPTITSEEIAFIMDDGSADITPKKRKTPWRHIITSKPFWAIVAAHTGSAAGYILILTEIPMYMSVVLGVDIKSSGVLSSLPYISMYLMTIIFGYLVDMLVNKKVMSVVNIRRMANTIGLVVAGAFALAFSYVQNTTIAIILLILSFGAHSGIHVGFHVSYIDLAPNFAGPLMSLGNFIANLTSLLVPVVVSNVVKDDITNQRKWQTVFLIFCGFQFVTNKIFVIFAKGNVQPWNFYGDEEYEAENGVTNDKKLNESNTIEIPLKS